MALTYLPARGVSWLAAVASRHRRRCRPSLRNGGRALHRRRHQRAQRPRVWPPTDREACAVYRLSSAPNARVNSEILMASNHRRPVNRRWPAGVARVELSSSASILSISGSNSSSCENENMKYLSKRRAAKEAAITQAARRREAEMSCLASSSLSASRKRKHRENLEKRIVSRRRRPPWRAACARYQRRRVSCAMCCRAI